MNHQVMKRCSPLFAAVLLAAASAVSAGDSNEAINGCEKVSCPAENGEFAIQLRNPDDCASFCKCDWGKAYWFACPPGLHFNEQLQVCDWPEKAGCSGR